MKHSVKGNYILSDDGQTLLYKLDHYDSMPPFFTLLATDNDLWMYLSSTGALTCGRRNPDHALFPYYTDDKITNSASFTGPRTLIREAEGRHRLWEPFAPHNHQLYTISRSIIKAVDGTFIIFVERNDTLHLSFQYVWRSAGKWGWVRDAHLQSLCDKPIAVEIIDGVQNILPAGVNRQTQNVYSTLVDAYKHAEQVRNTRLVLLRMEAIMVDRAEPSESLTCNVVYSFGAKGAKVLTSSMQLDAFRRGEQVHDEPESMGVPCAYFLNYACTLEPNHTESWAFVMDTDYDAVHIHELLHHLDEPDCFHTIGEASKASFKHLHDIVSANGGVIHTSDPANDARHFANVLYNTMRGGYFPNATTIHTADFAKHVSIFNKPLAEQYKAFLSALPESIDLSELDKRIQDTSDHQLHRLFLEFLPLTFARRHGDPSRPWNSFDIQVQDSQGKPIMAYQGNWRDIFQNWEALAFVHPEFILHMIAKFLNATTADGYNPYRITSEGVDWEVINPDDPWSNIGYWGDHQIIYLCKLLELAHTRYPVALKEMLNLREFSFANVPYRILPYNEIVAHPKDTIRFDQSLHQSIMDAVPNYGADARLVQYDAQPLLVVGAEKLIIPLLTKLSNFIPNAGIWMNTLRPEWNDANNALVGNGASMVTVYYMHRYLKLLITIFSESGDATYAVHEEVVAFMRDLAKVCHDHLNQRGTMLLTGHTIRTFTDGVGQAGERYRKNVYDGMSGRMVELSSDVIVKFAESMLKLTAASIRANRRSDGLYHAYNLVSFTDADTIQIEHLPLMLEGQVAVLSSGVLMTDEIVGLLDALRASDLYRSDQNSYMLYPNSPRPNFMQANCVNVSDLTHNELNQAIHDDVLRRDMDGLYHFAPRFRNAQDLTGKMAQLYEQTFRHHFFTGRSGSFFKYEGLGCIYWHMVSKLRLAVLENLLVAPNNKQLRNHYQEIVMGIGAHKSPDVYGAFPFDAYSHTPAMLGAQQPGMTGQVKEDIICYYLEQSLSLS